MRTNDPTRTFGRDGHFFQPTINPARIGSVRHGMVTSSSAPFLQHKAGWQGEAYAQSSHSPGAAPSHDESATDRRDRYARTIRRGAISQREKVTGRAFDRQIGSAKRGDCYADCRIRTGFTFDCHACYATGDRKWSSGESRLRSKESGYAKGQNLLHAHLFGLSRGARDKLRSSASRGRELR